MVDSSAAGCGGSASRITCRMTWLGLVQAKPAAIRASCTTNDCCKSWPLLTGGLEATHSQAARVHGMTAANVRRLSSSLTSAVLVSRRAAPRAKVCAVVAPPQPPPHRPVIRLTRPAVSAKRALQTLTTPKCPPDWGDQRPGAFSETWPGTCHSSGEPLQPVEQMECEADETIGSGKTHPKLVESPRLKILNGTTSISSSPAGHHGGAPAQQVQQFEDRLQTSLFLPTNETCEARAHKWVTPCRIDGRVTAGT